MRTAKMSVDGREYLLCFSGRVIRNVTERFGSLPAMYEAFSQDEQEKSLDAAVWVLSQMIQAGDRYAKLNGLENPGKLSFDDLYDLFDINDFTGIYSKIKETIRSGKQQTVTAVPDNSGGGGKNAAATPG